MGNDNGCDCDGDKADWQKRAFAFNRQMIIADDRARMEWNGMLIGLSSDVNEEEGKRRRR